MRVRKLEKDGAVKQGENSGSRRWKLATIAVSDMDVLRLRLEW
jgi:hypothetical protein